MKISHKKDGCQRQPHRFHVSHPCYPAAGSATGERERERERERQRERETKRERERERQTDRQTDRQRIEIFFLCPGLSLCFSAIVEPNQDVAGFPTLVAKRRNKPNCLQSF